MRPLAVLALLLFASLCVAGPPAARAKVREFKVLSITISDKLPPPVKYPAECYKMTDAEFFNWATAFNKGQVEDWKRRKTALPEPEYIGGTVTIRSREHSEGVKEGGYPPIYVGGNGYGYGSGSVYGGDTYGSETQQTTSYGTRYRNPYYVSPGPLTIINPYCRPTEEE